MIVNCPACSSRFRLIQEKFSGQQVSLKCVQCQNVFQVEVPSETSAPNSIIHILIAHSDPALCAMIREIVGKEQISCDVSYDGASALRKMEAHPPRVAIVDVALPGIYAFEVVEKVRSRPGLADVKFILLSSVYNKMAYKRTPSSLYGADAYIEKHHVANDLVPYINRLLTEGQPRSSHETVDAKAEIIEPVSQIPVAEKLAIDFTDEMNSKIQQAEVQETSAYLSGERIKKAHRLARNIVADIALYYQEKVEAGLVSGTFFELLEEEIAEGRQLFNERFPPEMLQGKDIMQLEFEVFLAKRRDEIA